MRSTSVRAHRRVSPTGRPHGVRAHARLVKTLPYGIRTRDPVLSRSGDQKNADIVQLTLTRTDAQLAHRIALLRAQQEKAYQQGNTKALLRLQAMEDDATQARIARVDAHDKAGRRRLRGGDLPDGMYPATELRRGAKVELEHTSSRTEARRIAKDHLAEDPHYYTKLNTSAYTPIAMTFGALYTTKTIHPD